MLRTVRDTSCRTLTCLHLRHLTFSFGHHDLEPIARLAALRHLTIEFAAGSGAGIDEFEDLQLENPHLEVPSLISGMMLVLPFNAQLNR